MSTRNSKTKAQIKERLLKGRQNGACAGCGKSFPKKELTLDHKIPLSKGGTWVLGNMQLMCYTCNQEKGSKSNIHTILDAVHKELEEKKLENKVD